MIHKIGGDEDLLVETPVADRARPGRCSQIYPVDLAEAAAAILAVSHPAPGPVPGWPTWC